MTQTLARFRENIYQCNSKFQIYKKKYLMIGIIFSLYDTYEEALRIEFNKELIS